MISAHQPGSRPIDIPEVVPNPAVVPNEEPVREKPEPKKPVKTPQTVPADLHARQHSVRGSGTVLRCLDARR